ncbi:unnamed protein product, partial [Rotaria sp. Silwood1]
NPREAKQQPQAASQQHHENLQASTNKTVQSLVKPDVKGNSLDDIFVTELKKLITDYIQRTTRPLPLKYFLDFTEQ